MVQCGKQAVASLALHSNAPPSFSGADDTRVQRSGEEGSCICEQGRRLSHLLEIKKIHVGGRQMRATGAH